MKRTLVLALSVLASTAHGDPGDTTAADALFREARAAMNAGDFETACPKLQESYRLDPAAGTAVNLGDCFDKEGKVGSALLAYQAARALLKPGDARITPVALQIAALEKRVPRLTITLAPSAPEGTVVKRDGRKVSLSDLGKAVPVNPGRLVLEVSAPGRSAQRSTLSLTEGETKHFVAEAGEAGDESAEDPASNAGAGSTQPASGPTRDSTVGEGSSSTTGLVLGGIGVVGVTTGIVTALMANSKMETVRANCDSNKVCRDQQGVDAAESGKTLTTVSYVGWGIGIVGLAAGSYFLLTGSSGGSNTTVDAAADGRGGRVTLRGRF